MMKVETSLVESSEIFKEIMEDPGRLFELIQIDLKAIAERTLGELLKCELTFWLGREPYQRGAEESVNYRNGFTSKKYTVKNVGELNLKIPRDRKGEFSSKLVKKYERYDKRLESDIAVLFLSGLSTRGIELISKSLLGRRISKSEVSAVNAELLSGIDAWRVRPLHDYKIKYMYVDGVNFHMRLCRQVEIIPMLVVIGVGYDNRKVFLTIQQGDKESATTWREVFKDLKTRGLSKDLVQLGVMDGLPGLMNVFREEFPNARIQRCQVHVARNVLCKVPKKLKPQVADSLRDIFYASSRTKAMAAYEGFVSKYEAVVPSAVKCLGNVIDECLTFYSFPEEEWISIRTTNVIERVNKEFKRRTKPMETLAGEASAYRLLCFVALKLEMSWRAVPINKNNRLPSLNKFTQNT
jgi:putative transposase